MKLTLPCEPGAGVTRTSIARSTSSVSALVRVSSVRPVMTGLRCFTICRPRYRDERRDAWTRRRLYFECSRCGHAKTEAYVQERQNLVIDCEACRSAGTFGPAKRWFRPPGFAHPIDRDPVPTADSPNETAYATRAKLVM